MKTDIPANAAPEAVAQEPASGDVRLIQVVRSTGMFAGWGPRMESNITAVLRSRN